MAARRPLDTPLTESQARHVLGVMARVDALLGAVEQALVTPRSPSSRSRLDLTVNECWRMTVSCSGEVP